MVVSIKHLQDVVAPGLAIYKRYQPHFSAASMLLGFGIDNYSFGRVDRPAANIVLGGYLLIAAGSIIFAHGLETRADRIKAKLAKAAGLKPPFEEGYLALSQKKIVADNAGDVPVETPPDAVPEKIEDPTSSRLRSLMPAATQFALGSLWSGFLVFYARSAVMAASWPFLLLLAGFLVGNELFRKYHSRLVFSSLLLLFAIYSYAIFVVPVFTHTIGKLTFIGSGVIAAGLFLIFLRLLKAVGVARFRESRPQILLGAVCVFAAMNAFYFLDILPPLPLALSNVGVYDSVKHVGDTYETIGEQQSWYASVGVDPTIMHVVPGKPLYVYSAVFAPIKLSTRLSHRWQLYDPKTGHWITKSTVAFPINGGREGGYRAYSIKSNPAPGDWRVDIRTDDNRLVGRVKFTVQDVDTPAATVAKTLQ